MTDFVFETVTHVTRFVMVGAVLLLLARRSGALRPQERKIWYGIAGVVLFGAVGDLAVDVWVWLLDVPRGHPARLPAREWWSAYSFANATMAAGVPAATILLLSRHTKAAAAAGWAIILIGVLFVIGHARGVVHDYDVLLSASRPLDLLSLGLYAVLFSAWLLGRMPRLEGHLAAYLAIWAAFLMLVPILGVFYGAIGIDRVSAVWNPQYTLMSTRYVAQTVVVVLLMGALGARQGVGRAAGDEAAAEEPAGVS
jgi:hypothetical protein